MEGAPLGARLCSTCHRQLIHEINDVDQPLVTYDSMPLEVTQSRTPLRGPCFFGHTHSSAQGSAGKQLWFCMPTGFYWNGATTGDILCNACFVRFKRKRNRNDKDVMQDDKVDFKRLRAITHGDTHPSANRDANTPFAQIGLHKRR